jgi:hypothetical protein
MADIAMMVQAVHTPEMLVNLYVSTRRYNPKKKSHFHTQRRENLKSYLKHDDQLSYIDNFNREQY